MKCDLDKIVFEAVKNAILDYNEKNGDRYILDDCGMGTFITDKKSGDEYCLSLDYAD